jgi:photosystem II stability/assembly factor-like uncharacterized protein
MSHVLVRAVPRSRVRRGPVSRAPYARRWRFALAAVLTLLLLLACACVGAATASATPPTIVPFTGLNGTVMPNVPQTVTAGTPTTFAITPAAMYHVADVKVDGVSVGAVETYTFANAIPAAHTIVATFAADAMAPWQLQQPMPTGAFLGGVAFTDADHGWAAGGDFAALGLDAVTGARGLPDFISGGASSLIVSGDGGATWTPRTGLPVGVGAAPRVNGANRNSGATGVATWGNGASASLCITGSSSWTGSSGVAYSHDGGATWTGVDTYSQLLGDYPGLEDVILRDVKFTSATHLWAVGAVDVYNGAYYEVAIIVESNDGGATWQKAFDLGEVTNHYTFFTGLSATDGSHCWVAGADQGGSGTVPIICATSDGTNWHTQSADIATDEALLYDVAISSDGSHGVAVGMDFVAPGAVIYTTNDGGGTWTRQPAITGLDRSVLTAAAFNSATSALAVGSRGEVLRGSVSGSDWTWNLGQSANAVTLAGIAPTGAANKLCAVGAGGDLQTSADAGVTWTYRGALTGDDIASVSSLDATHGWAVGWDNTGLAMFAATSDGGATWTEKTALTDTSANLYDVDFAGAQHGWAVGDIIHTNRVALVCATSDGGATWSQTPLDAFPALNAVDFFDSAYGWAVGEQGTIIRTTDGGANWKAPTTVPAIDGWLYDVSFVDATHGWAVGSAYDATALTYKAVILVTSDGGDTWTAQNAGVDASSLNAVSFADATHGWAVGYSAGSNFVDSPVILATSDGGAHWAAQTVPAVTPAGATISAMADVTFTDAQNGWAIGRPQSLDAGARGNPAPRSMASVILVTHNAGATWAQDGDAWANTTLITLDASSNGHAWAVGYNGTILSHPMVPPTTKVNGLPKHWVRHNVKLTFTATPSAGGAPVAYTEYRVGNGAWTKGTSVKIKRQGAKTVQYRSTDTAGNVETAQSCQVRIDRTKPKVRDIGRPQAWTGSDARFLYRLGDRYATILKAKLVITRYSGHRVTKRLGWRPVGRRLFATWRCTLPTGSYSWRIVATDPSGNRTAGKWHFVDVSPGASRR